MMKFDGTVMVKGECKYVFKKKKIKAIQEDVH